MTARTSATRPRATSRPHSCTRTAATPKTTPCCGKTASASKASGHRPLFESIQLPRVQGAHRGARGRRGAAHLLRSCRGWLCARQSFSRRPVGPGEPHPARRDHLRLHRARRPDYAGLGFRCRARNTSIRKQARSLPKIMALPLSWRDAKPLAREYERWPERQDWQGALPITYRFTGAVKVHVKIGYGHQHPAVYGR